MSIELRLGRWQEELAGVQPDCLITDAPYSERTIDSYRDQAALRRRPISYDAWNTADVLEFCERWSPATHGWFVSLTDHVLAPVFESALKALGRYVFSPLACVEPGSRVRQCGDGPAQWSCFTVVARPRREPYSKWGALPGVYVVPAGQSRQRDASRHHIGGKPLWLMRALVRDYSRPGDLICDPCAGGATTLLAAAMEGRRAIGAELDPDTYAKAQKRIARGYTPPLFTEDACK